MSQPVTDPFALARHLAVIKLLSQVIAERRGEADQISHDLPPGTSLPAMFGGQKAATVTIPKPSVYAKETDKRQLTEWVKANFPEQVITSYSVSEPFLRTLKDAVKKYGGWLDTASGEVQEVPGLKRVSAEGGGTPRVTLETRKDLPIEDSDAYKIISAAHRRGEIDLSETILALEPAEPVDTIHQPVSFGDGPGQARMGMMNAWLDARAIKNLQEDPGFGNYTCVCGNTYHIGKNFREVLTEHKKTCPAEVRSKS
jgi:hypothetical protein